MGFRRVGGRSDLFQVLLVVVWDMGMTMAPRLRPSQSCWNLFFLVGNPLGFIPGAEDVQVLVVEVPAVDALVGAPVEGDAVVLEVSQYAYLWVEDA